MRPFVYQDESGFEGWMDQKILIIRGLGDSIFQNHFALTIIPCLVLLVWSSVAIQYIFNGLEKSSINAQMSNISGDLEIDKNMILIPGGVFQMGGSDYPFCDTKPMHQVKISSFYLSKFEVTVAEFKVFIEETAYQTDAEKADSSWVEPLKQQQGVNWKYDEYGTLRSIRNLNYPVVHVSWNDASAFCQWLQKRTHEKYRLPTEAEWEFAAGGGEKDRTIWAGTSDENMVSRYANSAKDSRYNGIAPVGLYQQNSLGLHDMCGNVDEWCFDNFSKYTAAFQKDPIGPNKGQAKVLRGGDWLTFEAERFSTTFRYGAKPEGHNCYHGFRVAKSQ